MDQMYLISGKFFQSVVVHISYELLLLHFVLFGSHSFVYID